MGIAMGVLFFHMVISEIFSVWAVYYWLPQALRRNYMFIVDTIHASVYDFCANAATTMPNSNYRQMNAPEFLFVSHKVAKHFPDIFEAQFIMSYHNTVPGMIGRAWNSRSVAALGLQPFGPPYTRVHKAFLHFMTLPLTIQKLTVRLLEALLIFVLFLLTKDSTGRYILIALVGCAFLTVIVWCILRVYDHHKKEKIEKMTSGTVLKAIQSSVLNLEFSNDFRVKSQLPASASLAKALSASKRAALTGSVMNTLVDLKAKMKTPGNELNMPIDDAVKLKPGGGGVGGTDVLEEKADNIPGRPHSFISNVSSIDDGSSFEGQLSQVWGRRNVQDDSNLQNEAAIYPEEDADGQAQSLDLLSDDEIKPDINHDAQNQPSSFIDDADGLDVWGHVSDIWGRKEGHLNTTTLVNRTVTSAGRDVDETAAFARFKEDHDNAGADGRDDSELDSDNNLRKASRPTTKNQSRPGTAKRINDMFWNSSTGQFEKTVVVADDEINELNMSVNESTTKKKPVGAPVALDGRTSANLSRIVMDDSASVDFIPDIGDVDHIGDVTLGGDQSNRLFAIAPRKATDGNTTELDELDDTKLPDTKLAPTNKQRSVRNLSSNPLDMSPAKDTQASDVTPFDAGKFRMQPISDGALAMSPQSPQMEALDVSHEGFSPTPNQPTSRPMTGVTVEEVVSLDAAVTPAQRSNRPRTVGIVRELSWGDDEDISPVRNLEQGSPTSDWDAEPDDLLNNTLNSTLGPSPNARTLPK